MVITGIVLAAIVTLVLHDTAYASIGPGLGAGTIGVVLGFVASIFLALFALFWYPIKRLFNSKRKKGPASDKSGTK